MSQETHTSTTKSQISVFENSNDVPQHHTSTKKGRILVFAYICSVFPIFSYISLGFSIIFLGFFLGLYNIFPSLLSALGWVYGTSMFSFLAAHCSLPLDFGP